MQSKIGNNPMTEQPNYDMQRQIAADVLTKAGDRAGTQKQDVDLIEKVGADFHNLLAGVQKMMHEDVITALDRIFPDYGVLSPNQNIRPEAEFRWVLDPIDGGVNFARGLPLWGSSLALLHHHQAVVGVISIPDTSETYSASLGGQAFRNGAPIAVLKKRQLADAVVAMTWGKTPAHRDRVLSAAQGLVPTTAEVLSVGASSIALSWLAAGHIDAVVASGDLWEFAAGFLIAKQMGAVVTEWDGSRPTFRERDFFTLVSTSQPLHDELVAVLKDR